MVEIKVISYEEERLEFFIDQRQKTQRECERLERAIKPFESYLSERRKLLSDCARKLSFYDDVIKILEDNRKKN